MPPTVDGIFSISGAEDIAGCYQALPDGAGGVNYTWMSLDPTLELIDGISYEGQQL